MQPFGAKLVGRGGRTTLKSLCCAHAVVLWGPPGFPTYLFGRCPVCQEQLAAVQDGPVVARPLSLVYSPQAELRAYVVRAFDGRRLLGGGSFPGGAGVWELDDLTEEEETEYDASASQVH